MAIIKRILLLFLCCGTSELFSQNVILSGTVYDINGETLVGATISVDKGYSYQTNSYGFFSISVPKGEHHLYTSYFSYNTDTLLIDAQENKKLLIYMSPLLLSEVEIVSSTVTEAQNTGVFILPLKQLTKIPSLGGEQDVLKAMTFTPGVASGTEGTVGLYVRGGSSDQNLILLDDAVVYNPAHLFGFLSVFNPDALKHVELIKGSGPARYGGRTSSVLNILMKEGNTNKTTGSIGIGLVSSRGVIEGPIFKKKGSYMIAGRLAYLGLINTVGRQKYKNGKANEYSGYNMGDFNAKLNYRFSENTTLFISSYSGMDQMEIFSRDTKTEYLENILQWGNNTTTTRLTNVLGPKTYLKTMLIYSRFFYKNGLNYYSKDELSEQRSGYLSRSTVNDIVGKSEVDYYLSRRYTMRYGLSVSKHWFTPRDNSIFTITPDTTVSESLTNRSVAHELSFYTEQEVKFNDKMGINAGIRLNSFFIEDKMYFMPEPRILLHYRPASNFILRGSFTGGQQCLHLLSNAGLGFQNDVWVPVTSDIKPQKVWQGSTGFTVDYKQNGLSLSVDVFYKKLYNQIEYREGSTSFSSLTQNWYDLVAINGTGVSKGLEIGVIKNAGRFTGLFAYTLSKSDRRFDELNNGQAYPFIYDYTHNLNATFNYRINRRWDFSGTWVWHTGAAISFPTAVLNGPDNQFLYFYKKRNNTRLPDYMRGDIGFNRTIVDYRGRERMLSLSVYNVLFRKNPLTAKLINEISGYNPDTGQYSYTSRILLQGFIPIIPSVSYSVKF